MTQRVDLDVFAVELGRLLHQHGLDAFSGSLSLHIRRADFDATEFIGTEVIRTEQTADRLFPGVIAVYANPVPKLTVTIGIAQGITPQRTLADYDWDSQTGEVRFLK
jgi:hypothetical protein